jgi:septum formation protein
MIKEIILASKSGVRKKILEENNIQCKIEPSNVDEDSVKESLLEERASPTIISKNLAELKANRISQKFVEEMVLGADSVIDLEGKIISKPKDRAEALEILKSMNGKTHQLISSVCISRGGSMIWNYTEKASLTMKDMTFL